MKLQSILLLTGIAAGLMTVSCQSPSDEAEAFYGVRKKTKTKAEETAEEKANENYYDQINAYIERRLNEFNEKDEVKLPVFTSQQAKDDFSEFSFIKSAGLIDVISMDLAGPQEINMSFIVDRLSRSLTRIVGDKIETFTFDPFTNGIQPNIPYDARIIYAFATDFKRIADSVTLRCYDKLEDGENPAIAQIENEANLDKNGKKKDKKFVEIKPKVTSEPLEFLIQRRWCHCYDVNLKQMCEPVVAMSIFVSLEEKTISRLDLKLDDDSTFSYLIDWREQDDIVLPRVIQRLNDNSVYFRDAAKVLPRGIYESVLETMAELQEAEQEKEEVQEDGSIKKKTVMCKEEKEAFVESFIEYSESIENVKNAGSAEEAFAAKNGMNDKIDELKKKHDDMISAIEAALEEERRKAAEEAERKRAAEAAESDENETGETVEFDASTNNSDDDEYDDYGDYEED